MKYLSLFSGVEATTLAWPPPDGHTKVPYRGKPAEACPDAPRYKACGNSMCVNVMRRISWRTQQVEQNGLTEP